MSIIEAITEIPAEHEKNVFGQFDQHIKKIERTLNVTMILRDGTLKIIGDAANVSKAKDIVQDLVKLSMRGNTIEEQNINYALALAMENSDTGSMVEIDKDCICHTINGKVIKPKTLGQKAYVDAIRNKMIVFGIGPAGTGKTYLAMAMAISAFKNSEVSRIILTRPAIEAGEKLGFLPGDLQSKVDPYLRPLYDALYQIMGPDSFCKKYGKSPAHQIELADRLKTEFACTFIAHLLLELIIREVFHFGDACTFAHQIEGCISQICGLFVYFVLSLCQHQQDVSIA